MIFWGLPLRLVAILHRFKLIRAASLYIAAGFTAVTVGDAFPRNISDIPLEFLILAYMVKKEGIFGLNPAVFHRKRSLIPPRIHLIQRLTHLLLELISRYLRVNFFLLRRQR